MVTWSLLPFAVNAMLNLPNVSARMFPRFPAEIFTLFALVAIDHMSDVVILVFLFYN